MTLLWKTRKRGELRGYVGTMANKSLFLGVLLVGPLVASALEQVCSPTPYGSYIYCLPATQAPEAWTSTTTDQTRTFPPGYKPSLMLAMGMRSALPLWTNEVQNDPSGSPDIFNFGVSTCLNSTKKAVAVSGACICNQADQLVYSKPAFLNVALGSVESCGVGDLRNGVRPVTCNSWMCGCASFDRSADAAAVVTQAYCT